MDARIFTLHVLTLCCLIHGSLQGVYQRRLYKELMRNYNPLERPVSNDSHSLTVHFSFSLLQIMDVDEKNQVLTTNIWLQLVFVVSEAYSYSPDWAEILYQKVILKGDFVYLEELKRHRPLTSSLFEDIFKKLDGAPSSVTPNVKRLLMHCDDVYSRYRLAYQQNLYDVTKTLLQDAKTSSYLNDRLAS